MRRCLRTTLLSHREMIFEGQFLLISPSVDIYAAVGDLFCPSHQRDSSVLNPPSFNTPDFQCRSNFTLRDRAYFLFTYATSKVTSARSRTVSYRARACANFAIQYVTSSFWRQQFVASFLSESNSSNTELYQQLRHLPTKGHKKL